MATKSEIAELSIGIGLNDSKFSSQVSNINKQIKNMDRDLKSASNGVNGFENSFKGLDSKIQKSTKQIGLYNNKLESQKKEYDRLNGTLDRQRTKLTELEQTLGKTSKEYTKQEQLIQKTASKMSTLDSQITQTGSHLTRLGNELNDATRDMEKMNSSALTIEQRLASVGQRADLANSQFDRLGAELAGTGNFMNRLGNDMARLSAEIQQGGAKIAIYEAELNKLGGELQQNSAKQLALATSIQQVEVELLQVSAIYGNTSQEAQQLSNKLLGLKDDFNRNEHEIEQNTQALNRYQTELNQTEASVIRAGNSLRTMPFDRVGNSLKNVGNGIRSAGYSILPFTYAIGAAGAGSSKVALDIESAFAGVRKTMDTSGLSAEQADKKFDGLKSSIMEMSKRMPTSAVEIAKVAENAGQLGIESDKVLGFTETMVKLGDTTNLSAEEASTALSKLANITGMPQENFDRLGSTIVALGNNMATTEADISNMALRLAGAGSQVGMSEDEILSFSSALSSVGIEAEAGGSAFSKVMIDMQLATETGGQKLENFAKVAGMSSSEFSKAFKDDAPTAIMAFIEGLGKAEESGQSAIGILDDMGIKEVRLRDVLLRASSASHLFSKALGIGSQAWRENNALTKEAQVRYETTASKIAMAKNKLIETGQKIGEILLPVIAEVADKIADFASKFNDLDDSQQKTILKMAEFVAGIAPILVILGSVMNVAGSATLAFGALGGGAGATAGALSGLSVVALPALGLALLGIINTIGESENALDFLQDKFGILGTAIGGTCEFITGTTQLTFGNLLILLGGVAKGIGA
ncbi:phage tail tape measure protein, partial [Romboutsia sedimentorum]|uniref:phage tail tape measure protein n=1 Tax=Romboutsia sedimentorum TaxID=1368474 RepID=UPI0024DEB994